MTERDAVRRRVAWYDEKGYDKNMKRDDMMEGGGMMR
jgi:hypothetical protein